MTQDEYLPILAGLEEKEEREKKKRAASTGVALMKSEGAGKASGTDSAPPASAKPAGKATGADSTGNEGQSDERILPPLAIGAQSKGRQSGKGAMNSQEEKIVEAREAISAKDKKGLSDARADLKKQIQQLEQQKGQVKGKERTKLLKRIAQLRAALKVAPRFMPVPHLMLDFGPGYRSWEMEFDENQVY